MLRLDRIAKRRVGATILADVSLHVGAGECVVVTAGRESVTTALMQVAATLIPPDTGSLRIDGIDAVRDPYLARQRVAYAGRDSMPVVPGTRLRDLLAAARAVRATATDATHYNIVVSRAGGDSAALVETLSPPARTALAVALAFDSGAPVILLDNPFAALDEPWMELALSWIINASVSATAVVLAGVDPSRVVSQFVRQVQLES
jgi:ABC-type multidrug transport system ATPase subunit